MKKLPRFQGNIVRAGANPEIVSTRNFDEAASVLSTYANTIEDHDASISKLNAAAIRSLRFQTVRGREHFNVLDYGAKGDGVTDDTAAVQRAANAAGANDQRGVVFFPYSPNRYLMVNVDLSKTTGSGPVTIKGDNWTGTRIGRYSDTGHIFKIINTTQVTGYHFKDIQIDGTIATGTGSGSGSTTYDGIYTEYVTLSTFSRTYIAHNRYGVNLGLNTTLCSFGACTFGSGNVRGLAITTSGTNVFHRLFGCWFDENTDAGVYSNSKYVTFSGCQFLDNTGKHALLDASSAYNIFTGCTFVKGTDLPTSNSVLDYGDNNLTANCSFDGWSGAHYIIQAGAQNAGAILNDNLLSANVTNGGTNSTVLCYANGGFEGDFSAANGKFTINAGTGAVSSQGSITLLGANGEAFIVNRSNGGGAFDIQDGSGVDAFVMQRNSSTGIPVFHVAGLTGAAAKFSFRKSISSATIFEVDVDAETVNLPKQTASLLLGTDASKNVVSIAKQASANQAAVAAQTQDALTDSTGGTANTILVDVGVVPTQAAINDNFADLAAQLAKIKADIAAMKVLQDQTRTDLIAMLIQKGSA